MRIRSSLHRTATPGPSDDFLARIRRDAWRDWDRWTLVVQMDDPTVRQDEWETLKKLGDRLFGERDVK